MRPWIWAGICFSLLAGIACSAEVLAEEAKAKRPTVCFLIGEDEYDTKTTLPRFAQEQLEPRGLRCEFVHAHDDRAKGFPGIERLAQADLLVLSVRRRSLPVEQMQVLRGYVESGQPIVAIRTSSHAFALREGEPPEGHAAWPEFDRDVLGGHYTGHYGAKNKEGANTLVWIEEKHAEHPILKNVAWNTEEKTPLASWLYKSAITSDQATVLVWGQTVEEAVREPVAWTNAQQGRRLFYTSLGHPAEFKLPAFQHLLQNAVLWGLESNASR